MSSRAARSSCPSASCEGRAVPDQQAAEGHDEGRDPDLGDEVALQAADHHADDDAEQDHCDPQERLVEAGAKEVGIHSVWASPMTIAVKPMIEPMERSMSRDTMIRTMPDVMIRDRGRLDGQVPEVAGRQETGRST